MNKDSQITCVDASPTIFVITLAVGIYVGGAIGEAVESSQWEHKTSELGLSEYNSTNGNWQWKSTSPISPPQGAGVSGERNGNQP